MAGFVAGIVLTVTALSVMRDGASERAVQQLGNDDDHLLHQHNHNHHHRHHRHGGDSVTGSSDDGDLKVVDLSEQDKHKHTGTCASCDNLTTCVV